MPRLTPRLKPGECGGGEFVHKPNPLLSDSRRISRQSEAPEGPPRRQRGVGSGTRFKAFANRGATWAVRGFFGPRICHNCKKVGEGGVGKGTPSPGWGLRRQKSSARRLGNGRRALECPKPGIGLCGISGLGLDRPLPAVVVQAVVHADYPASRAAPDIVPPYPVIGQPYVLVFWEPAVGPVGGIGAINVGRVTVPAAAIQDVE